MPARARSRQRRRGSGAGQPAHEHTYLPSDETSGALVSVPTGADEDKAAPSLTQACQHIVSTVPAPLALAREEIPAAEIERELAISIEEVQGKPAEMQEKIVK